MAGIANTFENDILKLVYNATAIANVADNAATSPFTNLYVALHTADPGEAGDQTTSEATYTGYARVAVARTSGGWTVTTNSVVNAATVTFGACTAGTNTITHYSVGVAASAASKILHFGPVGAIANVGEFTSTAADVITIPQVTLVVDDRVSFYPTPAAVLPTGMTEGTVYFIKTVSGNDYTIATTSGGTTIDLTTTGAGLVYKHGLLAVSSGITPSFAASAISHKID